MDSPNFAQVTAALKNDFEFSQLTRKEERIKHLLKVLPFQKLFNNIQYQVDLAHPHVAKSRLQAADYLQDALSKENRGDLVGALFSIKKALLCAESPASGGSPLAMLYRQLARIQQKLLNYKGAVWAANQSLYLLEKDREGIHEEAKKELLAFLSEQTHEYGEVRNRINGKDEACLVLGAYVLTQKCFSLLRSSR